MPQALDINATLYGGNVYNLITFWRPGVSLPRIINGWVLIARSESEAVTVGNYMYVPPRGTKTTVAWTAGQTLTPPPDGVPVDGLLGVRLYEVPDSPPGSGEVVHRKFRDVYESNPGMDVLDAWAEVKRRLGAAGSTLAWLMTWGPVIGLGLIGGIGVFYGLSKVTK